MWFAILGPLLVRAGDVAIDVSAARQRVLLAALLVRAGQVVPAETLADVAWDGAPPAGAAVTLRSHVSRLRRALGPDAGARIITRYPGYLVEAGPEEADLLRFAHLYSGGGAAVRAGAWPRAYEILGEALGLWRGDPLADIPSRLLHRDEVPKLEQMRLQALEWRTDAGLRLGHHSELVPALQSLTAQHPLRERFHAQLMLAFYRCGRQAEALAAYQQARQLLITELAVEPGPELQELHMRILERDPALAAPVGQMSLTLPQQLPPTVRQFAGRASDLRTLTELLERPPELSGTVVISAIDGTAGVGKTALALHWAHQVTDRFPDGQLYVNLRGFDPSGPPVTPAQAIRTMLDAFGIPAGRIPVDLDAQSNLYRSLLAGRRVLVVLDNARDADHVRALLPATPGCLAVVTSRTQLASLAVDVGAHIITLDVLAAAEASELLALRIGAERIAREPLAAAELSQLSARLPLALAIAAARAAARPAFPLAALAAELRDTRGRLDALDTGSATTSVRAVFSWSYNQLSGSAARMFRLLGVHCGPDVTVPAAASLMGISRDHARQGLTELAHAHLLTEHAPGRYAFHDLLRAYAAEQAHTVEGDEGTRPAIRRALDHYLHTAHAAVCLLFSAGHQVTLGIYAPGTEPEQMPRHDQADAWCDAEYQVLLAAVNQADRQRFDSHAWQLACTLQELFDRRGHWHDWAAACRTAVAAAERLGDLSGQAHAHRHLGRAYARLDRYQDSYAHLLRALDLFGQVDDVGGQAYVHLGLGRASDRQGRYDHALHHGEQALALFRAVGQLVGQANALNALGWSLTQLGSHTLALARCQEALTLYRQLGHRAGEAQTWDSVGYAYDRLGEQVHAVGCYRRAIELCEEIGDRFNQAGTLTRLGDTYHAAGDDASARTAWQEALGILDDLQHPDAAGIHARLNPAVRAGNSQ